MKEFRRKIIKTVVCSVSLIESMRRSCDVILLPILIVIVSVTSLTTACDLEKRAGCLQAHSACAAGYEDVTKQLCRCLEWEKECILRIPGCQFPEFRVLCEQLGCDSCISDGNYPSIPPFFIFIALSIYYIFG